MLATVLSPSRPRNFTFLVVTQTFLGFPNSNITALKLSLVKENAISSSLFSGASVLLDELITLA